MRLPYDRLVLCIWLSASAALLIPAGVSGGEEHQISTSEEAEAIAKRVQPGDTIILKNGQWRNSKLKFEHVEGTANSPITIRAEEPGQVVFSGAAEFRLSGNYVTVSGLVFRNPTEISDVFELRTHSQRHAHHCRITDCVFEQTEDFKSSKESRWLSVYGTQNRIDHCAFTGKKNRGTTLVVWVDNSPGEHRIAHNYFGPRPELGSNGGETIRIGTSQVSELVSGTVVEDNYFLRCNGEAEIISNKSCENIYRRNWFEACSGALTLRHGHRCQVDGNIFMGGTQSGTGGVRIIGSDHTVTNNYFDGLRGDAERAAVSMMNGVPDSPLNEYAPVVNAVVAHNSFFDCKVSLELGVGAGSKQPVAPTDCRILYNLFAPGKWSLMRVQAMPESSEWGGNIIADDGRFRDLLDGFASQRVDCLQAPDGLMRPADKSQLEIAKAPIKVSVVADIDGNRREEARLAGCDVPGMPVASFPTRETAGPSWSLETK